MHENYINYNNAVFDQSVQCTDCINKKVMLHVVKYWNIQYLKECTVGGVTNNQKQCWVFTAIGSLQKKGLITLVKKENIYYGTYFIILIILHI